MKYAKLLGFIAASTLTLSIPGTVRAADAPHGDRSHAEAWSSIKSAVAILHPTSGNKAHGRVQFTQMGDSVKVTADLEGLTPGQKHAFHIHQYGDCSAGDASSAGGHYNPEGHPHALPHSGSDSGAASAAPRHAGDLGNVQADNEGKAHYEITVDNISVAGTKNPIIGRGVIVHAKPDDGSQPVGNAGGRIACGVIGVANPGK